MSRVGKKPVPVPAGVTASVTGQTVKMKGSKGELEFDRSGTAAGFSASSATGSFAPLVSTGTGAAGVGAGDWFVGAGGV